MPDWSKIIYTVLAGTALYTVLIFLLRISGKRTLSKWNSFDFIVTIAFGSTLASSLLNRNITILQSIAAFGLLIGLQFVITFLTVRSKSVEKLVKAKPVLLLYRGRFMEKTMKQQRISRSEVLAAVRNRGYASLEHVEAVVLETNGSFSVITSLEPKDPSSALEDVENYKQESEK